MADFEKNRADGRIAPGAAPVAANVRKPLTLAQRVALGIAAVVCVALIAVSGAHLVTAPETDGGGAGVSVEAASAADSADESSANAAAGKDAAESKSAASSVASQEGMSSQGASAASDGSQSKASSVSDGSSSGAASDSGSNSGSGSQGAAGSSASSAGSGSSSGSNAASGSASNPAPNTVTVSVSVSSSAVGNPVSGSSTLTFEKGATVYDALCGLGLSVNASSTAYGIYVSAIGGLAEKEHGANSGWVYYVNGAYVNKSCGSYMLSDGDAVTWKYVV